MRREAHDETTSRYLKDIRATRPVSREEERELFRRLQSGDQSARDRLIKANMRLVLKVALRYRGCPLPLPDLISEGAMGLAYAVDTYDLERGIKLISYAVWWIRAYMTKAVNEIGSVIRLPSNQHLRVRKALKDARRGSEIDDDIREMIQLGSAGTSFDAPLSGVDGDATVQDTLVDHSAPDPAEEIDGCRRRDAIRAMLEKLPEQDAYVIRAYYGLDTGTPQTLREIAEQIGVTHQWVQKICERAYSALRRLAHSDHGSIREISGLSGSLAIPASRDAAADRERFFSYVKKTEGCWIWTGTPSDSGAGKISLGRKTIYARRYAYELEHGPIPADKYAVSTCGVARCCNPAHTAIKDRVEYAWHLAAIGRTGGRTSGCRLTWEMVADIRAAHAAGGVSQRDLAKKHNVTRMAVSHVLAGRTWKVDRSQQTVKVLEPVAE